MDGLLEAEGAYAGQRTKPGPVNQPVYPVELKIDLKSHDIYKHGVPEEAVTELRKAAPIFWHPEDEANEPGFWTCTRYSDIRAIGKDPETYSSEKGAGAMLSFEEHSGRSRTPEALAVRRANMVFMDPPDHKVYRSLVMPYFSGVASSRLEPSVRERIGKLVDEIQHGDEFDLVTRFSAITPSFTLCNLLGVPEEDRELVVGWGDALAAVGDPDAAGAIANVNAELFRYGWDLLEKKKVNPGNDLLSAAIAAYSEMGTKLRPHSMESLFSLMIIAGQRTTRNTTTSGLLELYRHPEQVQLLRSDPKATNNAVEEMLRYTTVVPLFRRTTTRNVEIAGQPIAAGEKVVMWYSAGNRDEEVFPNPDRFDITRPEARKHLAFGFGEHMCPGNMLARMQIGIAVSEFVKKFDRLELIEEPEYLRTNQAVSIKRAMVRVS